MSRESAKVHRLLDDMCGMVGGMIGMTRARDAFDIIFSRLVSVRLGLLGHEMSFSANFLQSGQQPSHDDQYANHGGLGVSVPISAH